MFAWPLNAGAALTDWGGIAAGAGPGWGRPVVKGFSPLKGTSKFSLIYPSSRALVGFGGSVRSRGLEVFPLYSHNILSVLFAAC